MKRVRVRVRASERVSEKARKSESVNTQRNREHNYLNAFLCFLSKKKTSKESNKL